MGDGGVGKSCLTLRVMEDEVNFGNHTSVFNINLVCGRIVTSS